MIQSVVPERSASAGSGAPPENGARLSLRSFAITTASGFETTPIDLDCNPGTINVVQGSIGSGKSLLFEALVGMHRPGTSRMGEMHVGSSRWSHIPQDARLAALPTDRVRTLLRSLLGPARLEAERLLTILGLDTKRLLSLTFRQLSSGERTRVLWAMGLAHDGDLLIIDGFGEGVSEEESSLINGFLTEQARSGRTFLVFCRPSKASTVNTHQIVELGIRETDGAVPLIKRSTGSRPPSNQHALLEIELLRVPRGRSGLLGRRRAAYPVDGASLYMRHGETLVLLGPSGSGKTTLLETLAGLQLHSEGRIRLNGRDIAGARGTRARSVRRRMQLVFQDATLVLDSPRTVRAHLYEAARLSENAQGTPAAWLERLGLSPRLLSLPANILSVGESQRIDLARSLVLAPEVVLLDSPTHAGVEDDGGMLSALIQTEKLRGIGFLVATSSKTVAKSLADRVAIMLAGRIVEFGAAEKVLSTPAHPFTQDWLAGDRSRPTDPRAQAKGCSYVDSCPQRRLPRCEQEEPALIPLPRVSGASRRRVACFYPLGHESIDDLPKAPSVPPLDTNRPLPNSTPPGSTRQD